MSSLLIHCPTDLATVMFAVRSKEESPYLFADNCRSTEDGWAGFSFVVEPLQPINIQIREALAPLVDGGWKDFEIVQFFQESLTTPTKPATTLYLATAIGHYKVSPTFDVKSLVEMTQNLTKDRLRLPYLKVWQVLSGAHAENIKAVDTEEVRKALFNPET
jgi:hypothetical protein